MRKLLINFLIYAVYFSIKDINTSSERKKHLGKCVYIAKETGSKIINFHKYKNRDYSPKNEFFQLIYVMIPNILIGKII